MTIPPKPLPKKILDELWNNGKSFELVAKELEDAAHKHSLENTPFNPGMSLYKAFTILAEEVGEVARAINDLGIPQLEKYRTVGDLFNLQEELIQVAAMAVAMYVSTKLWQKGEDIDSVQSWG